MIDLSLEQYGLIMCVSQKKGKMKDYYKILGIKKTASEEEIREHWIELTKHYHPDLSEGGTSGEKIQEINEAYQVLKLSSTRLEYDLNRMYGQKKEWYDFRRLSLSICILIVFLIIGFIYFKEPQVSNQLGPITKNKVNPIAISPIPPPKSGAAVKVEKTVSRSPLPPYPTPVRKLRPDEKLYSPAVLEAEIPVQAEEVPHFPLIASSSVAGVELSFDEKPYMPIASKSEISVGVENVRLERIGEATPQKITEAFHQTDGTKQINETARDSQIAQTVLLTSTSAALIAREEEIKQFFVKYIERYTHKDIDGFHAFFSLKAIQNQKDGFGGIRKVYANFFKQSQELRYQIQDMKIEIYHNTVEVKARYELHQTSRQRKGKVWRGNIHWVLVREDRALKIISLDYQHQKSS